MANNQTYGIYICIISLKMFESSVIKLKKELSYVRNTRRQKTRSRKTKGNGSYKKVKRDKQITLYMTEEELEKLQYCADKKGKTRTSLIVDLVEELYLTIKKI